MYAWSHLSLRSSIRRRGRSAACMHGGSAIIRACGRGRRAAAGRQQLLLLRWWCARYRRDQGQLRAHPRPPDEAPPPLPQMSVSLPLQARRSCGGLFPCPHEPRRSRSTCTADPPSRGRQKRYPALTLNCPLQVLVPLQVRHLHGVHPQG